MAHALRRAGQEPEGAVTAGGTKVTMHSSPAGFRQTWENAGDKSEYRVDYVIGSGEHASGYLVNLGGHLFQSPVAYYRSRQSYDLAPGYENLPDPDFTRPVSEECVICHSGTALHVSGTLNEYQSPIFPAEGITCERCHGPAERHLADPRAETIVNPARLTPDRRDSVCEQCHLFGIARVPNPGKKLSDFVPGQRLEDTFTIYRNVLPEGSTGEDFKVISHVEQLALSHCARSSGNRLWCATCHNPHEKMSQSVEYYRARCLECHTSNFPSSHPAKDSDCLGCHMPRRNARDGGHTVFTDHRIQRRPEAPLDLAANTSIAAWREPPKDLQQRNLGIAYIDVGMQRHSSNFIIQGYRTLTGVQQQFADDSDFFKWIGEALLLAKQSSDAQIAFERAVQLDPNSALTEASAASPYLQEGDTKPAVAHLERSLELDPLNLPAASTLIGLYQQTGDSTKAAELSTKTRAAMNEGVEAGKSGKKELSNKSSNSAEDEFKNIQVLKGIPAGQLIPAMQFMSSSLGVPCSFCHVENTFEKDDKKPKQTARKMMQMVVALNKASFDGQREVTCYSCHRGLRKPEVTPAVGDQSTSARENSTTDELKLPTNLPTATQLTEKYANAAGGASRIDRISSRVAKGQITIQGRSVSIEIFTGSPQKQAMVQHLPDGDSFSVFDGHGGWISAAGRSTHEMSGAELESARADSDLQFPLHIQKIYPELRVEYPEKIGEREAYVLVAVREGQLPVKLYFDEQSALLIRQLRYAESPLGRNPTQIDYSDFREVDGVQVPFRVTISRPGDSSTIQFSEVRQNVPIDPAKFAKLVSTK